MRPSGNADASFAATIAGMYDAWGRRRGMQVEHLSSAGGGHLLAVSGLGCWRLLHPEAGVHVLEDGESPADGARAVHRETVRVTLVAHDPEPQDVALREADARAAIRGAPPSNVVVRRYRTGPSPLVRDAVRGYRTGNLDRVLGGISTSCERRSRSPQQEPLTERVVRVELELASTGPVGRALDLGDHGRSASDVGVADDPARELGADDGEVAEVGSTR